MRADSLRTIKLNGMQQHNKKEPNGMVEINRRLLHKAVRFSFTTTSPSSLYYFARQLSAMDARLRRVNKEIAGQPSPPLFSAKKNG
jgi:hypothetical protein